MPRLLYTRRTLSRIALTLAVILAFNIGFATAQSQEPDLATYEAWLREAAAAARRGDRLGVEDAAARLTATTTVRLDAATAIPVNNDWLRVELASPTPDLDAIAVRIGALIDALAQPASAAPADALARLDAILTAPPFDRPPPAPPPQWLLDFFDWLVRLIESIAQPIGAVPPAATNTVAWIITIIGIVILLGVIIYVLTRLRRGIVRDTQLKPVNAADPLTAAEALDQAGDLARDGDYRTAVRLLYLSALLWLDERKHMRYDRALTNREYLERARKNPALAARLTPVIETFDRVWYGHSVLDERSFAAYREQIDALRRELG